MRLEDFSPEVQEKTKRYYQNDARELRKVVDRILKKFGDVSDPEDFYSLADMIFVDAMERYDNKGGFDGFLAMCLERKIKTELTRRNRDKRKLYARDKNGRKVLDERGKPIVVPDICLDAPIDEDGTTYGELLPEKERKENVSQSAAIARYLDGLSPKQRQIAEYLSQGYKPNDICRLMKLSKEKYNLLFERMCAFENLQNLKQFRRRNTCSE